jgi:hypothetical protein
MRADAFLKGFSTMRSMGAVAGMRDSTGLHLETRLGFGPAHARRMAGPRPSLAAIIGGACAQSLVGAGFFAPKGKQYADPS